MMNLSTKALTQWSVDHELLIFNVIAQWVLKVHPAQNSETTNIQRIFEMKENQEENQLCLGFL